MLLFPVSQAFAPSNQHTKYNYTAKIEEFKCGNSEYAHKLFIQVCSVSHRTFCRPMEDTLEALCSHLSPAVHAWTHQGDAP